MTSDYAIVSNNAYLEVVNDEYIVVFNFAGRRMSRFEVIVGGGTSLLLPPPPPPMAGTKKKKEAWSE